MKKTLLAATIFAAFGASTAFAQSNVTIYGVVDAGIQRVDLGDDTVTRLQSGGQSGSRIGFRGTEDLGGGLSAIFTLENGFNVDDGTLGTANTLFNRQAWVGLQHSAAGAVKLGLIYAPLRAAVESIDPFALSLAGNAANSFELYGERISNTINYTSANYGGFVGQLSYSFGEVAGETSAGRHIGASAAYGNGPVKAVLAYHKRDLGTAETPDNGDRDTIFIGGIYDFSVVKLHAGYARNKGENRAGADVVDSDDLMVGVSAPLGAGTILASYIQRKDDFADDADSKRWSLGYTYALSKRTNLYTSYSKFKNDVRTNRTFGSANAVANGVDPSMFNIGVRHLF